MAKRLRLWLIPSLVLAACESPGGGGGGTFGVPYDSAAPTDTTPADTSGPDGIGPDTSVAPDTDVVPDTGAPDASPADTTPGPEVIPSEEGPRVLSLSTNVRRVTQGQGIVFSAVVTDPDGIDDLIGGTLRDPTTDSTYGAFATSAAEGAYELALSWSEIQTTSSIDFATEIDRVFHADFFDQAGHKTTAEVRVTLHCDGGPACAGTCGYTGCDGGCIGMEQLGYDTDNCGACGRQCADTQSCRDGTCTCAGGETACGETCTETNWDPNNCGGCGAVCASGTCEGGLCACAPGAGACGAAESCIANTSQRYAWFCFETGALRLRPGTGTATSGVVEMEVEGDWLPACTWSEEQAAQDAQVACRELFGADAHGFGSVAPATSDDDGVEPACAGQEDRLTACNPAIATPCGYLLNVTCVEPGEPTPAGDHLDVSGSVASGAYARYQVEVTAGRSILIELAAAADVDLYVRLGGPADTAVYDDAATSTSGYESLVWSGGGGTLHIAVYGYEPSSFTLRTSDY